MAETKGLDILSLQRARWELHHEGGLTGANSTFKIALIMMGLFCAENSRCSSFMVWGNLWDVLITTSEKPVRSMLEMHMYTDIISVYIWPTSSTPSGYLH